MGERGNCCLQRGLAENRTPWAAGRSGFCSPRKQTGRRGRQQSQGYFSCWTPITGEGSQLRQSTEQPCPKGKTEGASGSLFKCSCYIRDLTIWELLIKTLGTTQHQTANMLWQITYHVSVASAASFTLMDAGFGSLSPLYLTSCSLFLDLLPEMPSSTISSTSFKQS